MPAGRERKQSITQATAKATLRERVGTVKTVEIKLILLGRKRRIHGDCMTCTVTCMSGVRIGMESTIIPRRHRVTQLAQLRALTVCYVAVIFSTQLLAVGRRAVAG